METQASTPNRRTESCNQYKLAFDNLIISRLYSLFMIRHETGCINGAIKRDVHQTTFDRYVLLNYSTK